MLFFYQFTAVAWSFFQFKDFLRAYIKFASDAERNKLWDFKELFATYLNYTENVSSTSLNSMLKWIY